MKTNRASKTVSHERLQRAPKTHGGAVGAVESNPRLVLEKLVMNCFLFEDTFYASGSSIAQDIYTAATNPKLDVKDLAEVAATTRLDGKLRHVPLLLLTALEARRTEQPGLLAETAPKVILRADELAEWVAVLCRVNGQATNKLVLSKQARTALAAAFVKFNAYDFAKYNRDQEIKLRDVMFLAHPKPRAEQVETFKLIANGKLAAPDTWEVELSRGKDKKATFERLILEKKLGDLAFLRNLRGMLAAGVPADLLREQLGVRSFKMVLPMRFIAAAKHAPALENSLDQAMVRLLNSQLRLPGKTLVVVDVSGSMMSRMSSESELMRLDGAAAIAAIIAGRSEQAALFATAGSDHARKHKTVAMPPRQGMALRDAIYAKFDELGKGGIFLVQCLDWIAEHTKERFDRVFVITDEQDCDDRGWESAASRAKLLGMHNYVMNIAPYKVGLDIGTRWVRISGLSERVVDWALMNEQAAARQGNVPNQ